MPLISLLHVGVDDMFLVFEVFISISEPIESALAQLIKRQRKLFLYRCAIKR